MLPVTGTVSSPHSRAMPSTSEPGAGEQVRAVVEPVLAARVRAHPPAETIAGLQEQDVAVAQPPCRGKAGDAAADDHHVARHRTMVRPERPQQARLGSLVHSKAELLSLQQLRCFCAAVELGSFTAAAEVLRVSQPAVAEQVRKLEQALGADLFVRAGRGVVATEAGRAFAEHAARSLRAVEDAADSVGELTALRGGTVALGIFGEPSAWRVDELVAAFLRRHPDVSLRLVGRNSSAIAERVRRGELEAGVVLLPIDDDTLDVRPIVRDEILYVSASARAHAPARHDRAARRDAAGLLRRRVRRQGPDPPPARRTRADPRRSPAAEDRGRAQGHRAPPRRDRHRRHLPPQRLHPCAVLPRGPQHRVLQPASLRHVRDHHPPRGAALTGRARAARRSRGAHARRRGAARPLTLSVPCRRR